MQQGTVDPRVDFLVKVSHWGFDGGCVGVPRRNRTCTLRRADGFCNGGSGRLPRPRRVRQYDTSVYADTNAFAHAWHDACVD